MGVPDPTSGQHPEVQVWSPSLDFHSSDGQGGGTGARKGRPQRGAPKSLQSGLLLALALCPFFSSEGGMVLCWAWCPGHHLGENGPAHLLTHTPRATRMARKGMPVGRCWWLSFRLQRPEVQPNCRPGSNIHERLLPWPNDLLWLSESSHNCLSTRRPGAEEADKGGPREELLAASKGIVPQEASWMADCQGGWTGEGRAPRLGTQPALTCFGHTPCPELASVHPRALPEGVLVP